MFRSPLPYACVRHYGGAVFAENAENHCLIPMVDFANHNPRSPKIQMVCVAIRPRVRVRVRVRVGVGVGVGVGVRVRVRVFRFSAFFIMIQSLNRWQGTCLGTLQMLHWSQDQPFIGSTTHHLRWKLFGSHGASAQVLSSEFAFTDQCAVVSVSMPVT